jgi:protein O-GlcNAc transferase
VSVVGKTSVATVAIFCRLTAFYAPDTQSNLEAALALIKSGNWQQAEILLDKHLSTAEPPAGAMYWKAYVQFRTERYGESVMVLREHLDQNPDDGQARKLLGLDLFMVDDAAAAQAELERAVELLPRDEEARYYLGRVYFSRQNMAAALTAFKEVVQIEPRSVRAYNHLGQTYEALNEFERAHEAYEKAIAIDRTAAKRSEWPHYNLGVLYVKAGRAEEGLQHLREALQVQPKFGQGRMQLAVALGMLGKPEQAKTELEAVISEQPSNADAHYQLGRLHLKMGDQARAREHLLAFQRLKQK